MIEALMSERILLDVRARVPERGPEVYREEPTTVVGRTRFEKKWLGRVVGLEPSSRPEPPRDDFGIEDDVLSLIRTKEVVAALSYLVMSEPSFNVGQRRRLEALAASIDRYGCGVARYVTLNERNAEGWLQRLEGMARSAVSAEHESRVRSREAARETVLGQA